MFSDPLSVTYNSVAKSLPRQGVSANGSVYGTSDGEFNLRVDLIRRVSDFGLDVVRREVKLTRNIPDTTDPAFTQLRFPLNSFGLVYETDVIQTQASTDIPLLRTALLALVDSTFQGRILGGEQ